MAALVPALLLFVGQVVLLLVFFMVVSRPMSMVVDYLPIALGSSVVAGLLTWTRGQKLPHDRN